MSDFKEAVEGALKYAKEEADSVSGGDPATSVTAEVDGRSGFASNMKKNGTEKRGDYVIKTDAGSVKMGSDYSLSINVLSGTDIQKHSKKIRAYRAFDERMGELGYNTSMDINTYSR